MKLCSFLKDGKQSYGILSTNGIIDIGSRLCNEYPDLKSLISANAISNVKSDFSDQKPDFTIEEVEFLPVIANPGTIYCIGLNYDDHRKEAKRDRPEHPPVFIRTPDSQTGHLQPLILPPESTQFDYEGEIAVIIGHGGRRIPKADAWNYIAGLACYNDGSIRDWQRHAPQWTAGKNFYRTASFGPCMVTTDEIGASDVLTLTTRLNGQVMQSATSADLLFDIPALIAYVSTFLPLKAGDVIATGTPGGVGIARTPQVWMKPGDVVEVEIDRIGILRNEVIAEG